MGRWTSVEGGPFPLGATWIAKERAWNFAIYSRAASRVTLLFYRPEELSHPIHIYPMDPLCNKTHRIWHCRVKRDEVGGARYYAYSIDGPATPGPAWRHAFDPDKVLLDPYATDVYFPPGFDRETAKRPGPTAGKAPLGVLPETEDPYSWDGDRRPHHESDTIIYEMHVRGFTKSPTSGVEVQKRGTYAGLIEKIPYLKELGVTVVELMPVQQFDPQEDNFWGYMTLNFFAPHIGYASDMDQARNEFRRMVKALHAAGIEVILDVVYNHTAEGDHRGPTYSYKGIDNATYYMMGDNPQKPYLNYSGTGNTFNCANRYVRTMIVDSLRYWVTEMHVDGFRFDLASIFTMNTDGTINYIDPPLLTAIRTDPVLLKTHLIAEPWDAAGTYQLGTSFPGRFWHQWNGQFRDDLRRFVRGDGGMISALMMRLYGSDDLFPDKLLDVCRPYQGINFVCSHDGFSLYDQVAYNERHNLANGHDNTDGHHDNYSWNCGWEGDEGAPPEVLALRRRQVRNFFCLLMLANGIPMFRAGDEFLQTQQGNNNPYNQDNETSWLNWNRLAENQDMFRFVKGMIAFRKAHPSICRSHFWREDIHWFGPLEGADCGDESRSLAYCLHGESHGDCDLYVMINGGFESLAFKIQEPGSWRLAIDTSQPSPADIREHGAEQPVEGTEIVVQGRSVVVLINQKI